MSDAIDFSLGYIKRGWPVFPLHTVDSDGKCSCDKKNECEIKKTQGKHPRTRNGLKDATTDEKTVLKWWDKWPDSNIGIATGKESGLLVLDVDNKNADEGEESLHELMNGNRIDTVEVLTGKGRHLWFVHPGGHIKSKTKIGGYEGLDIRADGGYIIAPPSKHYTGRTYEFEASSHPNDIEIAPVPEWLNNLLCHKPSNDTAKITKYALDIEKIAEGQRNTQLTSFAGKIRRPGFDEPVIEAALQVLNRTKCTPPLPSEEVRTIAHSVAQYKLPNALLDPQRFHFTDLGNADRMVHLHGNDIRHCVLWNKWIVWDGSRWLIDTRNNIYQKARDTITAMYQAGVSISEEKERGGYMSYVSSIERSGKIHSMIRLASTDGQVAVTPDVFDTHKMLLNVANGTIDLKTGELREHRRADLITKIAPVVYDQTATCPQWIKFLSQIMQGNQDLLDFLKMAVGMSLTGITRDHLFFIFYGMGMNGKSTFLDTIMELMGEYGLSTPVDTFLTKRNDQIPNDVARLKGARFVSATESPEGRRLNETLIKAMTGGDVITARFLHAEFFDFHPEFKLFIGTNHKPVVKDNSFAMWRRVRLVPFNFTVSEEDKNPNLKAELRNELPGILNWALDGCTAWQVVGELKTPAPVKEATEEYRSDMDVISDFIGECCIKEPMAEMKAKILYDTFKKWCEESGEKTITQTALGIKLKERGFEKERKRDGYHWIGFGLK